MVMLHLLDCRLPSKSYIPIVYRPKATQVIASPANAVTKLVLAVEATKKRASVISAIPVIHLYHRNYPQCLA